MAAPATTRAHATARAAVASRPRALRPRGASPGIRRARPRPPRTRPARPARPPSGGSIDALSDAANPTFAWRRPATSRGLRRAGAKAAAAAGTESATCTDASIKALPSCLVEEILPALGPDHPIGRSRWQRTFRTGIHRSGPTRGNPAFGGSPFRPIPCTDAPGAYVPRIASRPEPAPTSQSGRSRRPGRPPRRWPAVAPHRPPRAPAPPAARGSRGDHRPERTPGAPVVLGRTDRVRAPLERRGRRVRRACGRSSRPSGRSPRSWACCSSSTSRRAGSSPKATCSRGRCRTSRPRGSRRPTASPRPRSPRRWTNALAMHPDAEDLCGYLIHTLAVVGARPGAARARRPAPERDLHPVGRARDRPPRRRSRASCCGSRRSPTASSSCRACTPGARPRSWPSSVTRSTSKTTTGTRRSARPIRCPSSTPISSPTWTGRSSGWRSMPIADQLQVPVNAVAASGRVRVGGRAARLARAERPRTGASRRSRSTTSSGSSRPRHRSS